MSSCGSCQLAAASPKTSRDADEKLKCWNERTIHGALSFRHVRVQGMERTNTHAALPLPYCTQSPFPRVHID